MKTKKMGLSPSGVMLAHHERSSGFDAYCVGGHTTSLKRSKKTWDELGLVMNIFTSVLERQKRVDL